jgi:hypothetical protein
MTHFDIAEIMNRMNLTLDSGLFDPVETLEDAYEVLHFVVGLLPEHDKKSISELITSKEVAE